MFCLRIRSAFRFFLAERPAALKHIRKIYFYMPRRSYKNHIGQKKEAVIGESVFLAFDRRAGVYRRRGLGGLFLSGA